jgi:hypothetical protein
MAEHGMNDLRTGPPFKKMIRPDRIFTNRLKTVDARGFSYDNARGFRVNGGEKK